MTNTISKKQYSLNQKQVKRERRLSKRQREQSREGHATGYPNYRETAAAKVTGYRVVKQQLPWIGVINKKTGKLEPFKGDTKGESNEPFFIHPITKAPTWYGISPPSEVVVRYIYESTHPLAVLPRCTSPTFGVAV